MRTPLADFFSILLGLAAGNLSIVRLQHDPAGWFDKHHLALIQRVGTIEIHSLRCLPELDMQLTSIRLLPRRLVKNLLVAQLFPHDLCRRPMVLIERRAWIG